MVRKLSIVLLIAVALSMISAGYTLAERPKLYGLVVVIDPGHGGRDPGALGYFPGRDGRVEVAEDEYVYDAALRLRNMCIKHGAIVIMTTRDKKQTSPHAGDQLDVIPADKNEVFTLTGGRVRSDYLSRRTRVANQALRDYPEHRVVFISIHFDATGNPDLQGVHFIAPNVGEPIPRIIELLEDEFRKADRIRTLDGEVYHPIQRNGTVRNLYVMRPEFNDVDQRVLIELGNFTNPHDVWRIRSYAVRENYCQIVLRALIRLNNTTGYMACRDRMTIKANEDG